MKAFKGGKKSSHKENKIPNSLRAIQQDQGRKEIIIPNVSEHKYSAMLLELIKPHQTPEPDIDEIDWLLQVAVTAWNVATMKKIMPFAYQIMLQEVKDSINEDKKALKLLPKLIKDKEKKFGEFDLFIHDYEFKITDDNDAIVTVRSTPLETFLPDSMIKEEDEEEDTFDDFDDYDEGYNYEPGYVNRNAFMVTPREPFMEWIKSTDVNILFPIEMSGPHIYLVEEKFNDQEIESWIKQNFERIFTKELEAWYTDKKLWPKKRTYAMFREWFTVSCHSMVYDWEDFPVDKDMP